MAASIHDVDDSIMPISTLTTENLHKLNFSRAQIWSKFMEKIVEREDHNDVFKIENVDSCFGSSDEELEDDIDSEGFEVKEANNKAENTNDTGLDMTVIEQNLTINNAEKVLAVIAQNPTTTGFVNEDREFLEMTLPFFENYNREMRESGLYNVLGSFDTNEINRNACALVRHTGGRNNNAQLPRSTAAIPATLWGYNHCHRMDHSDSDSDSIDTARYIRSSKRESKSTKRYATKKTTIKSYRTIKSKRDELRKKYSYLVSDEIVHCTVAHCCRSMSEFRSFHRSMEEKRRCAHYGSDILKHHPAGQLDGSSSSNASFEVSEFLHGSGRAHQSSCCMHSHCNSLISRCASLSLSNQPGHDGHCQCQIQHNCAKHAIEPFKNQADTIYEGIKTDNKSARLAAKKSTVKGVVEPKDKRVRWKTQHSENPVDFRIKRRAVIKDSSSELSAQSKGEDSSTANDTPIKAERLKNISSKSNQKDVIKEPLSNLLAIKNESENVAEMKKQKSSTLKNRVPTEAVMQTKPNNKHLNDESQSSAESETDDMFEMELQLALKASKATYIAELEKRQEQKDSKPKLSNSKPQKKNIKNIYKRTKKFQPKLQEINSECESEENVKLIHHKNKQKPKLNSKTHKSNRNHDKCQASIAENEASETKKNFNCTENTTFFSNISKVCNSTATTNCKNGKEMKKIQEATHVKKSKPSTNTTATTTAATDTNDDDDTPTNSMQGLNSTNAKLKSHSSILVDDDASDSSDCKVVSSTSEPQYSAQKENQKTTNSENACRVLLYAPQLDTTLMPECSFANNKYHLTLEHLSSLIGSNHAEVFFRYYKGKRIFKLSSTVYYEPPRHGYYSGNDTAESDIDPFDTPDIGKVVEEHN